MIQLLDKSAQRIFYIIQRLSADSKWHSERILAEDLAVSPRTLGNDIKIIQDRWPHLVDIEVSQLKGVRITNPSMSHRNTIIATLVQESIALSFLELIFLKPYQTIDTYAELLFTSKSTLLRLIPKINDNLTNLRFAITAEQTHYFLKSDKEVYLRKFYTRFFNERYSSDIRKWKEPNDFDFIESFCHLSMKDYNLKADVITHILYEFLLLVTLTREDQGFQIEDTSIPLTFTVSDEVFTQFRYYYKNITPDAIGSLQISSHRNYVVNLSANENIRFDLAAHHFISNLENSFKLHLDNDQVLNVIALIKNTYFKYYSYPFARNILFDRIAYYSENIKKENPRATAKLAVIARKFSEAIKIDFDLIFDDLLYLIVSQIPEIITRPLGTQTILYVSDLGLEHGRLIAALIKSTFNLFSNHADLVVEVAQETESLHLENLNMYSIILTNLPNLNYPLDHILVINDYPSETDLFQILQLLNKQK